VEKLRSSAIYDQQVAGDPSLLGIDRNPCLP